MVSVPVVILTLVCSFAKGDCPIKRYCFVFFSRFFKNWVADAAGPELAEGVDFGRPMGCTTASRAWAIGWLGREP